MLHNHLAGGSNSPIPNWDGYPEVVLAGRGAEVFDQDGRAYIDMWMGYGALMFGHAPDFLVEKVSNRISDGWFFSYPTLVERELAAILHDVVPCAETVRFATTGSDAVAYAVRAARSYTGRSGVVKVTGSYHGVHEGLVSAAGTSLACTPSEVLFNDLEGVDELLSSRQYACLIVEPVLANAGTVPPSADYLKTLRTLCTESGTVLIFDEVVTGFRVNVGGAQREFNVVPDIATFSKAIAGGLPLSAICGEKSILNEFMPQGKVLFAGTFNGFPLAVETAKAVIAKLKHDPPYKALDSFRRRLTDALQQEAHKRGLMIAIQGYGSMFSIAFDVDNFTHGIQQSGANEEKYIEFVKYLASNHNLLLPPLYTETIFLSEAHIEKEEAITSKLLAGLNHIANRAGHE